MNQFVCVLIENGKINYFSVTKEKICIMIKLDTGTHFLHHFQYFLKKFSKGKDFISCWFELRSANKSEFRKDVIIFYNDSERATNILHDLKRLMQNDSINFLDTYHQGRCVVLSHFKSDEHIYEYFGNLLQRYARETQEEE